MGITISVCIIYRKKKWCHDVNGGGKCQEKNLNCSLAQLLQLDPLNLVGINY